jgi:hypothetical protein
MLPLKPAENLTDAFNAFDPRAPLSGPAFEAFYVPRPVGIEKLIGDLQVDDNATSKLLFTGHRGSGKSTELIRLASALSDHYFTVYYTVEEVLDMADIDYKDVLLSLGYALYSEAKAKKVRLPKALLEDLVGWYSTTLKEVEGAISADAEVEEKADFWFLKLLARQRSEVATREVIRRQLESRLSDLIVRIDDIVRAIEKRAGHPVLAIVDGLDKVMDLDKAQRMYYTGGANLTQPHCKAIYTVPLALFHTSEFGQVRMTFDDFYSLPNLKVHHRDGRPDETGRDTLHGLIHRRVAPGVLAPEAVGRLAELSGGVLRELVALARDACSFARVRKGERVEVEDVEHAASRLRSVFAGLLTDEHYRELWRIHTDPHHRYTNSEAAQQLVHNLSLLEYDEDGDSWWDVHPVVRPLLEERRDQLIQNGIARA